MVYRISTDKGTLEIQTDDPDVEVVVKQSGQLVTILDGKTNKQIDLKSGDYECELGKGADGLRLVTDKFVLKRGDKEIVRIRREPVVAAKPPVAAPVKPPAVDPKAEESRRLEEWRLARDRQVEELHRQGAKRHDDYERLMTAGEGHMKAERYGEAVKVYRAALVLMPGDATATHALRVANRACQLQIAGTTKPPPTGTKHITNAIGMKLVRIPAGTFLMGSPASEGYRGDARRSATRGQHNEAVLHGRVPRDTSRVRADHGQEPELVCSVRRRQ